MTNWGPSNGTATSLCRLIEISTRAARAYEIAIPTIRKNALRNLVTVLLQQHVSHARRLHHFLNTNWIERESDSPYLDGDSRKDGIWNQIDGALTSDNQVMILNGCRCVERAVTAEYRAVVGVLSPDLDERQVLTVQLAELLCGQESIDLYRSSPFGRFARKAALSLRA